MSVLIVCVCMGAMIPAALIGPHIDRWPMAVMWGHTVGASLLAICGVVLLLYGNTSTLQEIAQKKGDREKLANKSRVQTEQNLINEYPL